MTYSIDAQMAHSGTNSLSPDDCVLIPVRLRSIHDLRLLARPDDKRMAAVAASGRGVR